MYDYAGFMPFAACQAEFIRSVISGRAKLPSYVQMEEEVQRQFTQHLQSGQPPKSFHLLVYGLREHVASLEQIGGFKSHSKAIIDCTERLFDLILVGGNYVSMREDTELDVVDDETFIQRQSDRIHNKPQAH